MPRKLRRDLADFFIRTAQEQGWSSFKNGALLREASAGFDVLVTIDQRMRYQQNVREMDIGIIVIEVPDTRRRRLRGDGRVAAQCRSWNAFATGRRSSVR